MLHLPHFPSPHFILFSRVVYTFSCLNPSFSNTGNVNFIIIGGPHTIAIVLSLPGAVCSTTVGTKPTLPVQSDVSPPGSTVVTRLTSSLAFHSLSSCLYTRSATVLAP